MFSTCPKHSDCQKPKQSEDTHAGNDCRENATERTFPHPSSAAPQGVLPAGDMSQRDAKGLWLPRCMAGAGQSWGFGFLKPVAVELASLPHSGPEALRGLPGEPRPSALAAEVSQIIPRSLSRFPFQHAQLLQALFWSRLDFSF